MSKADEHIWKKLRTYDSKESQNYRRRHVKWTDTHLPILLCSVLTIPQARATEEATLPGGITVSFVHYNKNTFASFIFWFISKQSKSFSPLFTCHPTRKTVTQLGWRLILADITSTLRKIKPFKNRAIYFPPHLQVVKRLKFPPFVKDNHTNQFAWFLSMEHQVFRCKTRAIVYLKTHASWMNPRRDKEFWKRDGTKKEAFRGPAVWHTCPIVHNQAPLWEGGSPNQQEKLRGRGSQPAPSQQ